MRVSAEQLDINPMKRVSNIHGFSCAASVPTPACMSSRSSYGHDKVCNLLLFIQTAGWKVGKLNASTKTGLRRFMMRDGEGNGDGREAAINVSFDY